MFGRVGWGKMSMVEQNMLLKLFFCLYAKNQGTYGDNFNIFIFPLEQRHSN